MFVNPKKFLALFSGVFFAQRMPKLFSAVEELPKENSQRSTGKGKGRRSPSPKNAAIHKRAAKKANGRAVNKARHAG